jgi:hypothetical protein
MLWLDDYERRARLVPGLLLIAPIALAIVAFGLKDNPVVAAILGALTAFGAPVILANLVRHSGLAAQDALWASWGGKPTTVLLQNAPAAQRQAWRAAVEKVSGQQLPAIGQADDEGTYDAATSAVISATRDKSRFNLLFVENRNYGYERNLYGLRRFGRLLSATCLLGSATAVGLLAGLAHRHVRAEWVVGLAALLILTLIWILLPSRDRARTTAYKYGEQLLNAAVELAGDR